MTAEDLDKLLKEYSNSGEYGQKDMRKKHPHIDFDKLVADAVAAGRDLRAEITADAKASSLHNTTVANRMVAQGDSVKAKFTGGVGAIFVFYIFLFVPIIVIAVTPVLNFFMPAIMCGIMRWICDKTRYGNKRFRFNGTGMGLIGNYIKWYLLSIITLGIYSFWAARNQIRWVVENIELVD